MRADIWGRCKCIATHSMGQALQTPVGIDSGKTRVSTYPAEAAGNPTMNEWKVLAWGSNEYGQLGPEEAGSSDYRYCATRINSLISRRRERECASTDDVVDDADADIEILCNGGTTAILTTTTNGSNNNTLTLHGQICIESDQPEDVYSCEHRTITSVTAAALGHEHVLVLLATGQLINVMRDGSIKETIPTCQITSVSNNHVCQSTMRQMVRA